MRGGAPLPNVRPLTLAANLEALLEYFQGSPLALWGLFAILILCGLGLPMPEDIVLVTAGLIAAESGGSWIKTSLLMYVGVIAGDSIVFIIGRQFGTRLLAMKWMQRMLTPKKRERIEHLFEKYGSAVFFIARFLPGLRAPIFWTAGAMKARYVRFLMFDGAAALVSVPAFVFFGHWLWGKFGDDIEQLTRAASRTHSFTLVIAVVAVIGAGIVVWVIRRRTARA